MLLTNYKHTQPTLGLSVTFVFNIEYIYIYIYTYTYTHTYTHTYIHIYIVYIYIPVSARNRLDNCSTINGFYWFLSILLEVRILLKVKIIPREVNPGACNMNIIYCSYGPYTSR